MTLSSSDFKMHARNALAGRWLLAVISGLIVSLLCGNDSSGIKLNFNLGTGNIELHMDVLNQDTIIGILGVFGSYLVIIALIYALLNLLISGVISLGYAKFNLNLINDTDPKLDDLISQIHRFKPAFCLHLLTSIYTFLWSLLFIIPGIIAALSYSMAPFIMYENPDMSASEAIEESKHMMDGYKLDLFVLELSFIGWAILCAFTLGIGNLFLNPYMEASKAAFYRELKNKKYGTVR